MKPILVRSASSGCWLSDNPADRRRSYEALHGPQAADVEIMANSNCAKSCVHPDHLRLSTEREPSRKAGHPISDANKQRIARIYQSTLSHGLLADVMDCTLDYIREVKGGAYPAITAGLKLGEAPAPRKRQPRVPAPKVVDTYPYKGEQLTASQLARLANCLTQTMKTRLRRMTAEEAVAYKFKPREAAPVEASFIVSAPVEPEAPTPKTPAPKAPRKRGPNKPNPTKTTSRHMVNGKMTSVIEMARMAKVTPTTIYNRLKTMTPDEAVGPQHSKPGRPRKGNQSYPYKGQQLTVMGLMPYCVTGYWTLSQRLSAGWDVDTALTTPVRTKAVSRTEPGSSSSE